MNPAPNLVLVGPMGAGKSSIGKRLAERFGLAFVDVDREIETRTGATVTTIFECEGEAGFRARERAAIAEAMALQDRVVATGGGAVLDAGNRSALHARGYVVHLHVDLPQQIARLLRDRTRPLLRGGDPETVLRALAAAREPLYREVADLRFETDAMAPADAAGLLGHLLEHCWQRPTTHSAPAPITSGSTA